MKKQRMKSTLLILILMATWNITTAFPVLAELNPGEINATELVNGTKVGKTYMNSTMATWNITTAFPYLTELNLGEINATVLVNGTKVGKTYMNSTMATWNITTTFPYLTELNPGKKNATEHVNGTNVDTFLGIPYTRQFEVVFVAIVFSLIILANVINYLLTSKRGRGATENDQSGMVVAYNPNARGSNSFSTSATNNTDALVLHMIQTRDIIEARRRERQAFEDSSQEEDYMAASTPPTCNGFAIPLMDDDEDVDE